MKLSNRDQVQQLNRALDRCTRSVWIESISGERIDLKDPATRQKGIARLMRDDANEMDLYTAQYNDFIVMAEFLRSQRLIRA